MYDAEANENARLQRLKVTRPKRSNLLSTPGPAIHGSNDSRKRTASPMGGTQGTTRGLIQIVHERV
jgi:hypothetical protein